VEGQIPTTGRSEAVLDTIDAINSVLLDAAGQPWVPLALLLFCAVDGIFPPVPSESLVVGLAAIGMSSGSPSVWLVLAVAATGAVLGDTTAFLVGRRVGTERFAWMRTPKATRAIERAGETLDRRSASFIITGRFVPVGRVAVNLTAGASGMPIRRFLPLSLAAGVAWATFSVVVGLLAGSWVRDNPLLGMALAISLALVLGTLLDHLVQRLTRTRGRPVTAAAPAGLPVAETSDPCA
jgi:membrane protein DedA with SNARE-associated domain